MVIRVDFRKTITRLPVDNSVIWEKITVSAIRKEGLMLEIIP